ncbi:aminotransferase class V-fold PLP-dependent enzyme [Alkalihalobacterium alkalinitrilicum]|uniref:aminotransferase class V-fold PLP-dependent enzyme n=1 Tax=Alkalihalobacterium alkalinitrilicum TaxID=427920 RepID=UPI0009953CAF|nr:aminotransferase class V-fold PLP-dependent enzyme [Alkalihalobacterium alkalinitrilicum]
MSYIYFDQAASSFPKPKKVGEAVLEAINDYGANPGRGGHTLAVRANDVIFKARKTIAMMFGEQNPANVCFYLNATQALNQAIQGVDFKEGDHVITTSFEHNSVRRPLERLKDTKGIKVSYIEPAVNGKLLLELIEQEINENTKAIVVSHGSNVTGTILPIEEIGMFTKVHDILFVVDASQTAGILSLDMKEMNIDMLAFPGHKGLMGPQGTGVLIIRDHVDLIPLIYGGTGSHSEDVHQPEKRPERYESGTLNTPGIAGLLAGIEELHSIGIESIYEHEAQLTTYCLERLSVIEGIQIYGPQLHETRLAVISFTIEGIDVHEVAMILDQHYQIGVRAGLHCSPLTHSLLGTEDGGAIRVSFGYYNTIEEVDRFIDAIKEIKSFF